MNNKSCVDKAEGIKAEYAFLENFPSMEMGYILVMATDRLEILRVSTDSNVKEQLSDWIQNVLEIRMFNDTVEHKWFRGSIDKAFSYRKIEDQNPMNEMDYWDEYQYLDIDLKASKGMSGNMVCATGGGVYSLPIPSENDNKAKNKEDRIKDIMIRIRNYLGYERCTGQLYISDWRLVNLIPEAKKKKETKYGR